MNYFSLHMVQDIHLTWTKKIYTIILQIFGHEALFDKNVLSNHGHCEVFNIEVPRVSYDNPWPILAPRKLYNPFKWLELGLTLLVEVPGWAIKTSFRFLVRHITLIGNIQKIEHAKKLIVSYLQDKNETTLNNIDDTLQSLYEVSDIDYKDLIYTLRRQLCEAEKPSPAEAHKILDQFAERYKHTRRVPLIFKFLALACVILTNIAASIILDLPFAIVRRILAPGRYIVRPFLQYARTDPAKWTMVLTTAILITLFIGLAIFSGGILSAIPVTFAIAKAFSALAALLGATSTLSMISLGILFTLTAGVATLACLQKTFMGITELAYATRRIIREYLFPLLWNTKKSIDTTDQNKSGSVTNSPVDTTTHVAQFLHGVNPEIVVLKPIAEQDLLYSFALFTGTESVCYSKPNLAETTVHSYGEFPDEINSPNLCH